jgi:hypothetical protein
MIYYFTPYSLNKKLFEAYDDCMALLKDDDWACFLDGDTLFFESNFGHQVQEYVEKYPDTGLFTCYSSRCGYGYMVPPGTMQDSDSIIYHRKRSKEIYQKYHLQVLELNQHIAGHLMCIKKNTWMQIREDLMRVTDGANLLGVDTQITNKMLKHGFRILLMQGIYLMHYYRLMEGKKYKDHLMDNTINILIRSSNREQLFNRCIKSIRDQTYADVNILVSADDENTAAYVRAAGIEPVMVQKRFKTEVETAPYNLYLNELIARVKGGWIFILDDDDYLADGSVLEQVTCQLHDDNVIYFVKMRWPTGRIIPSPTNFKLQKIVRKDIGMPCFIFHAKHKHKVSFDGCKAGDYSFVSKLSQVIKKQCWIDLVVTQTGNTGAYGGATDSYASPGIDVVYVLGRGSIWMDNEIRYSIRSFKKHFRDLRNIIIVGECPYWLRDVIHIPVQDNNAFVKDSRMLLKLAEACKDPRVSDQFIFCTDDTLLNTDLSFSDFKGWHEGAIMYDAEKDIQEHRHVGHHDSTFKPSAWYDYVYATGTELKKRGLADKNYDRAHCPQPVDKKEFLQVLAKWDIYNNAFTCSNIYLNSSTLFPGEDIRGRNGKIYNPMTPDEIRMYLADKIVFNFNDHGLTDVLQDELQVMFPDESEYELFFTSTDKRKAVEDWFKKGCNYDEGVAIVIQFAPRNVQLKRFLESKKGQEIGIHKLQQTLRLWLR